MSFFINSFYNNSFLCFYNNSLQKYSTLVVNFIMDLRCARSDMGFGSAWDCIDGLSSDVWSIWTSSSICDPFGVVKRKVSSLCLIRRFFQLLLIFFAAFFVCAAFLMGIMSFCCRCSFFDEHSMKWILNFRPLLSNVYYQMRLWCLC